MSLRDWESRLGVRLDTLEHATPAERADIHRLLLAHEAELDAAALEICERLLPLLNVKNARELSELIVRRWPDSSRGREIAARLKAKAEQRHGTDAASLTEID